jgi:biopolymer transport protein ExbD
MHVPSSSHRRGVGANMTPMIDVVFLLIIFFLVSSHLARQENRLPLDLPLASTFDLSDPEKAPLTISVDAAGDWLVGGDVVDLDGLRAALASHRANAGSAAAVRIRSEGRLQYRFVEPVLREAALAGVTDASIAVREASAK